MKLKALVGSGDKIALFTLPFFAIGLALNAAFPSVFRVGGPPTALKAISILVLIPGAAIWLWSVVLVLSKVPRGELIAHGPFALVKHPLYTSVAMLVLPWAGFLLDSWLGALIGIALYVGSRRYSPAEERMLANAFGEAWRAYCAKVKIRWL